MNDLIQSSKCDFITLENCKSCWEVEAVQLPLMVMLGSHDSGNIAKLSQIWFSSQIYFLHMVSLGVNFFLKDVWYCKYNILNF